MHATLFVSFSLNSRISKRSATTTTQRNVSSMGLELTIETMRQSILDINHKLHTQHEQQQTQRTISDVTQLMAILGRLEDMVNKISAKSRIQEIEARLEERDRECAKLTEKVAQLEHQDRPSSPTEDTSVELRFGGMLASAAGDNTIRLWDVTSGECVRTIDVRTFGDVFGPIRLFSSSSTRCVWPVAPKTTPSKCGTSAPVSSSNHSEATSTRSILSRGSTPIESPADRTTKRSAFGR